MKFYTGNYSYTNHNFSIENMSDEINEDKEYYPIICVVENIILRGHPSKKKEVNINNKNTGKNSYKKGNPTIMSKFLQEKLDVNIDINKQESIDNWFKETIALIDRQPVYWDKSIKGSNTNNYNPALEFYKDLSNTFPEYPFIEQLILPEASVKDILDIDENIYEEVDFYLSQAKLIIEIDGSQHKTSLHREKDMERDNLFKKNSIEVIRIDTKDIRNKDQIYKRKIGYIKDHLDRYAKAFEFFKDSFHREIDDWTEEDKKRLVATEILRNQIAILELLKRGQLDLNDDHWDLSITGNIGKDSLKWAIEDIFLWFEHICQLAKIDFKRPLLNIEDYEDITSLNNQARGLKIDSNIFKRYSDQAQIYEDVIFIRTAYLDLKNNFRISTSDPIKYEIFNYDEKDKASMRYILENIFGFKDFRPGQLGIIINSLERRDTIGLLPTGSGKSLCYQLVALLQPTIALVVCPIKSLMYDQKENLDKIHISNTNTITSDISPSERSEILNDFASGKYSFLWISPERFQTQDFRDRLSGLRIGLGVIDEVHCLSEWGHDFRTSYLNLVTSLRGHSSDISLLGLTATASSFVLEDLKREFDLDSFDIKTIESYDRKELNFYVKTIPAKYSLEKELYNTLLKVDGDFGFREDFSNGVLVFTRTANGRNGCFKLSQNMQKKLNMDKVPFYSGSKPKGFTASSSEFNDYKFKVQKNFKNNSYPLLLATKAFGMGIDKSNIRSTIHCGIPSSLESLYQEAGRAGRDRKDSDCYIIYQEDAWIKEEDRLKFFDEDGTTKELEEIHEKYTMSTQGDVLGNFYFYLNSTKGFEYDFSIMAAIVDKFAVPNTSDIITKKNISSENYGLEAQSMEEVQKAVYRLKLLGIVEDWTVETWEINGKMGRLRVYFEDYKEDTVKEHLVNYIKRYTPDFEYEEDYINSLSKGKYRERKYIGQGLYEYIEFLLIWTYDNILYNRRKSIENISSLCADYKDSKSFKEEIDRYFKFTDDTYSLDYIAQNPNDTSKWAALLIEKDQDESTGFIKDRNKLLDIRGSLKRMFESYRFNDGLDYIDGMTYLFLNNGELNEQSREKLKKIFEKDRNSAEKDILKESLGLIKLSKIGDRSEISSVLCEAYSQDIEYIYEEIKDDHSLTICIEKSCHKLKKINEGIKW